MLVTHDLGHSVKVSLAPGRDLFTYDYAAAPKPFVHPLRTPSGRMLTNFQPRDHTWHRGLWFAIKYINGKNYWEEEGEFGRQVTLSPPNILHRTADTAKIVSDIEWQHPDVPIAPLAERRSIEVAVVDDSAYSIDFEFALTAKTDLTLDRTLFTTWGGYGGLTIRGSRSWLNSTILISDGSLTERPTGVPGRWAQLSGDLDGDRDISASVAIFDHPANSRHPTPWYGATGGGLYLNPAFLFHEPMSVSSGETLTLRYRVSISDGVKDAATLDRAWRDYAERPSEV